MFRFMYHIEILKVIIEGSCYLEFFFKLNSIFSLYHTNRCIGPLIIVWTDLLQTSHCGRRIYIHSNASCYNHRRNIGKAWTKYVLATKHQGKYVSCTTNGELLIPLTALLPDMTSFFHKCLQWIHVHQLTSRPFTSSGFMDGLPNVNTI